MGKPLLILAVFAALVVGVILAMGLRQFGRGGVEGAKRSNKLMQWRIMAQAGAVLIVLLAASLAGGE